MKKTLSTVLGSLILATTFYACTKHDSPSAPQPVDAAWKGETQLIKLALKGDLVVTDAPLGNGRAALSSNARASADSVLYAVDIRINNYQPFAQGILKRLDTVSIEVPKNTTYTIYIAAIRKGSGQGLYTADSLGMSYFDAPIHTFTNFSMTKDSAKLDRRFLDTLSYFGMSNGPAYKTFNKYSELDVYYGSYYGSPGDSVKSSLPVSMRRLSYGFKFKPVNFTGGSLNINYGGLAVSKDLTTNYAASIENLYTADFFKYAETLNEGIPVTLQWNRPDGSIQNLGTRVFYPKRNVLSTVSITLPDNNGNLPIKLDIAEQTWKQDTLIRW